MLHPSKQEGLQSWWCCTSHQNQDWFYSTEKPVTPEKENLIWDNELLPTVGEGQVADHVRSINGHHKSMRPESMHLRVPRQLAGKVAKPLSFISEKSCQTGEVPSDWKRGSITPTFKKGIKKGRGTTGKSVPPLVLARSWSTQRLSLEGTTGIHLVQAPCSSRMTWRPLLRIVSRWLWNISREGDSETSLGNLFQGSVTLTVKIFFLMFRQNFLWLSLCLVSVVLPLGTNEKSLAPYSWHPPFRYLHTLIRSPPSLL